MNKIITIVVLVALLVGALFALGKIATEPTPEPTPQVPSGQATSTPSLDLTYVTPVDWPPTPTLDDAPYSCTEAGSPGDRAGETTKVTIEGREWCRTVVQEGAAGSIYSQYAYLTAEQDMTLAVTFSIRMVQCANFDEPNKTACVTEQSQFDPDGVIMALY